MKGIKKLPGEAGNDVRPAGINAAVADNPTDDDIGMIIGIDVSGG